MNASFWDTKEFQTYFMDMGREVSRKTIRTALKEMGARYVKAQHIYAEADEEQRREFAEQFRKDMEAKPVKLLSSSRMKCLQAALQGRDMTGHLRRGWRSEHPRAAEGGGSTALAQ
jgi:hypothetical protein